MSIEGRIAIDVNFADSTSGTGVQGLKKLSLAETTAYTTGKVALVSGTCATAIVSVSSAPANYKDAAGADVTFATVTRVAFACSRAATLRINDGPVATTNETRGYLGSDSNSVASTVIVGGSGHVLTVVPEYTSGTAAYTLVLYGT